MTTTFNDILEEFRAAASDNRDLGDKFERLVATYLMTDPQYSDRLSDVWLWQEWPGRGKKVDTGIDLVARESATGDHWAIQCKFYDPAHSIQKSDIDSFFTASGQKHAALDQEVTFAQRLIFSTSTKWSKHAEDALEDQTIPTFRISAQDMADSPVDWSLFSLADVTDIRLRKKKELRPHQTEAHDAVQNGFAEGDRGKLIMACGTGKTFTSLKVAENQTPANGRILFLAPSISLVSQTLREWTAESIEPIHAFVVCSDTKVGKETEDIRTHDLAFPATTDAKKLTDAAQVVSKDRRTVIFSTYQSIQVVSAAQKLGLGEFDLIICDEAHRTTGISLENVDASDFLKVHDQSVVRGKKRLYMTATPRIYADASKTKANDSSATLYSMDDENLFGQEFYRLGFGKAVDKGLLSEYKVLIVAVDEDQMAGLANKYNAFKIDSKKAIDTKFVTKIIGSWKGLSKQGLVLVGEDGKQENFTEDTAPMRRAVAFSSSISNSQTMTEVFKDLITLYNETHDDASETKMVHCEPQHVDGKMNSLVRLKAIEWLKAPVGENNCRILSNARCLSEGIDVPALDSVIFFDTRESIVDIVQSVGRVMRKADGKQYGYIILPVGIPSSKVKDYNSYIESDAQFKGIWKVIKALRAHDESLVDEAEFRRKIKIINDGKTKKKKNGGDGDSLPLDFPALSIDAISDAVYAAIPKKLGDIEYWSEWAKSVAQIAERLIARIRDLLKRPEAKVAFDGFLKGLRENLNPAVSQDEAIEMLAQHIITRPVFEALFAGYSFTENNPVSKAMQAVIDVMDDHVVSSETEGLEKFYTNIRERVALAKSDKSRQDIIKNLYDTFFNNAFPRMAERLGIVYTPIEVVDFIVHSAEAALQKHFNTGFTEKGVQILDPFTGTGTFIVRLLQSGLIKPEDILHKYQHEMHANELVLLAYYIATVNIESAQHAQTGEYHPFDGIVLTDTFQMGEADQANIEKGFSVENSERVNRQKKQPIQVIMGNPPYSAQQESQNDNNRNIEYISLDARIRATYAAKSSAANKKNLYDSYIRAIRWASDRIKDKGIVAFVTNGSFLDGNNMDGLRKSLTEEFSHLYVFNLRGNARLQGEDRRKEAGGVFGEGSRTPVAITIMVKDPVHSGAHQLHYLDIGDYLSREEKLAMIEEFVSIEKIDWQRMTPNSDGDWINQRNPEFETFVPLGDKSSGSDVVFSNYSLGVGTNRDAWVLNFSNESLAKNMALTIGVYNQEVERYKKACAKGGEPPKLEDFVVTDPKKISWSSSLLPNVGRGRTVEFNQSKIIRSTYRPFSKQWLYFDGMMNHRVGQWPQFFPTSEHENIVISATGIGATKAFSALVSKSIPDLEMISKGQCFPLYWYEKIEEEDKTKPGQIGGFFDVPKETSDAHGYVRRDAITDWALDEYRKHYSDTSISKEDIFYYVYGVLHSPEYKQRFSSDLKKMLPRIPFVADFQAFSKAGRDLAQWHLNYETVEPYPLVEHSKRLVMETGDHRVSKMVFGKKDGKPDKSVIVYNGNVTLSGIPLEAYEYIVNGKSALDWIMERYAVTKDRDSGIENDPNAWSDDPRYIIDLVKRIVRVSLETVAIVKALPGIESHAN